MPGREQDQGEDWGSSEGPSEAPHRERDQQPGRERQPEHPINDRPDYWGPSDGSEEPRRVPEPR